MPMEAQAGAPHTRPGRGVSSLVFISAALLAITAACSHAGAQSVSVPASQPGPSEVRQQGARVLYSGGLVTVTAHDSTLDEIVQQIAAKVGVKVDGRASNEKVFGTYGPEAPAVVLTTLLDGSGSNLLIVQSASDRPLEIILTPRSGGVSPPTSARQSQEETANYQLGTGQQPPMSNQYPPQRNGPPSGSALSGRDTNPAATAPSTTEQQVVFPRIDATTPPATGTTTPTTSGSSSPKTPQQIFEELQRLRNQSNTSQPN